MRKIINTSLPALLFLASLVMVLFTFVGCGEDGGGGSAVTLTGLSINGPSSMSAYNTATYTAIASWSDNSISTVTPMWSVNSFVASISPDGVLSCSQAIVYDEPASLTATYSSGGITKTATKDVTITISAVTLTGLSINGPSSISEGGTATYTATASWSDNSTATVTPAWSVASYAAASISPDGVLSCPQIVIDEPVWVTATYSSGGISKTVTKVVTITNIPPTPTPAPTPIPFHSGWLSGQIFYEENIDAGGVYHSYLYRFNADSSFERYSYENPPAVSNHVTGTWSIGAPGEAILNYSGGKAITVKFFDYPFLNVRVSIDDGIGTPYNAIWEWSGPGPQPFNGSLILGTYVNQYGDTWIFNSNGTGSATGDGGSAFTWSVDSGILKVVFPNGYVGWMYQRPSENTSTDYPVMEWAYVLKTPTGDFHFFYGGMRLTRQ